MFSSWPAPESMIFEVSFRTRSDHGWRPVGSRIRRTTRTRPGGAAGGSCAKRPHSRSPGHDPPNPASPSTTGPSAERAREQQQGAYAVGFSLGGGLALCQPCRPDHNLPVWSHAPSPACKRGQPLWRVVYPHAPASVMSGRGRPSPGCVRVLGMGRMGRSPEKHTLSYRTRARGPSGREFPLFRRPRRLHGRLVRGSGALADGSGLDPRGGDGARPGSSARAPRGPPR